MIKLWHFSDSHQFHRDLVIPENVDIAIFSGDCSNSRDLIKNEKEVRDFIDWYSKVPILHKIFVGGNHDLSIEKGWVRREDFVKNGIIYLENDFVIVEKLKIWGSPITPTFGKGWAWNMDNSKISRVWDLIPEDTDIIVVHGPPKHILDYSYNRDGSINACGCSALRKKIFNLRKKAHKLRKIVCLFGHIHDCKDISNSAIMKLDRLVFSNGTCVMDGKIDLGLVHNGNVIELS